MSKEERKFLRWYYKYMQEVDAPQPPDYWAFWLRMESVAKKNASLVYIHGAKPARVLHIHINERKEPSCNF